MIRRVIGSLSGTLGTFVVSALMTQILLARLRQSSHDWRLPLLTMETLEVTLQMPLLTEELPANGALVVFDFLVNILYMTL